LLSNRQDLLPPGLVTELSKLQDGVPSFSSALARKMIEKETGKKIAELFKEFGDTPIASASIAQVHRAVMHDGRVVAVKVRRPDIVKTIESDLRIMRDLAVLIEERFPSLRVYDPRGLVKSFDESLRTELDFVNEAASIRRFHFQFKDNPEVHVPYVVDEVSTGSILTMEFIEGRKIFSPTPAGQTPLDLPLVADRMVRSFFVQIFRYGFFQADPHPGNFLILKGNVVGYLDFGMMGSILRKDMELLGQLVIALAEQDVKTILRNVQELAGIASYGNIRRLEYDTNELVNRYAYMPDFHNHIGEILMDLTRLLAKHGLRVPTNFFLLIRALFALEGLARKLDPNISMYELLKPEITRTAMEIQAPEAVGRRVVGSLRELVLYLQDFPQDLKETMRMIKAGEVKVDLEHKGIDPVMRTVNRVSRQMVAAIFTGALLVGSAMLHVAKVEPLWGNVPSIAVVGYILAGIVGLGTVINLMRSDEGS
jgi:ubiquinone biosynthesis protein